MSISVQDALVYLMVVTSAADREMTDDELGRIGGLVDRLPVFEGYGRNAVNKAARDCVKLMETSDDLNDILDIVLDVLPVSCSRSSSRRSRA